MKKLYTLLLITLVGFVGHSQIISIPDANFKAKLLSATASNNIARDENLASIKIDTNNDGQIEVSEALTVYYLAVNQSNIGDMTGIQSFVNLRQLLCGGNTFTSLTVSALVNLQEFYCDHSLITSINIDSLVNLNTADFDSSALTSLTVSNLSNLYTVNTLISPNLTSLTFNNCASLSSIDTQNCDLNTLTLNNCPQLFTLKCNTNNLQSLDVSNCSVLNELDCHSNQLETLNLDTNHYSLNKLDCSYNNLTSLALSNAYSLSLLVCNNNNLTTLDLSYTNISNTYNIFQCDNNNLTSLFIKNGQPNYGCSFSNNPNLQFICVDDNPTELSWFQSYAAQYGYTNCTVNTYCSFTPGGYFYTLQGTHRWDINNDGCDASDILFPNMKFTIGAGANSATLISGGDGSYHYNVQNGTYSVTPILQNPTYFNVTPATASVTFPTSSSPFTQNFCVSSNGVHNDLEVVIIPISGARPGFDVQYKIIYKNKGNTTQGGTVDIAFDDSVLDFVSAAPIITTQATNNLSWSFSNLLPFETREILLTLNVNSPTEIPAVNSGDVLSYNTAIVGLLDETPIDNTSTLNQIVTNALDPNDKTCIEGTTVSPSIVGEYVHYVVRFENDGTANAQNIVVKDIIDTSRFEISTLVPLSGSASFVTRITNTNRVEFIFENINLPFDDAHNDGYIAFKIKTKSTLVVGDTFSNTANIYFDYNFPITTNTATTTIQTLGTQDFEFSNLFSLSPVPAKNSLTITTRQAVTISSLSIYNSLGQLLKVITNPNETIDVSGLKTGSYFIKIICDKGTASSKFIKE